MSIKRTQNWLPQQRVDLAHLRSVESSIAADFDVLAGNMIAGSGMVVRGFALSNTAAGTRAAEIQMSVAGAAFINQNATEAGSIFWVPENTPAETLNPATNHNVVGSFVASQTNYIGLDLSRVADDSTTDLVQFRDPNTLDESPRSVPLARTLRYRIVISTVPFGASPNLVPIAKVVTDGQNLIATGSESVVDARPMLFRLGSGGDTSNQYNSYSWPSGRAERDPNVLPSLNRFDGGDKTIQTQKDWMDAVMTRLWEVGGGQHWYSPTADRNIRLAGNGADLFTTTGDNFEWGSGTGTPDADGKTRLRWRGLVMLFDNSDVTGVYYNTIADNLAVYPDTSNTLEVGECIYVDIDRTANATVTAHKGVLQTLGTPTVPGSRVVLAWRSSAGVHRRDGALPINTTYPVATTGAAGAVRLAYAAGTPATPTVWPLDANNSLKVGLPAYSIASGAYSAIYAYNSAGGVALKAESVAVWTGDVPSTYGSGTGVQGTAFTIGVAGFSRSNPSTLTSGTGVFGQASGGEGVYGKDDNAAGIGVRGSSVAGIGGSFSSTTGTALQVSGNATVTGAATGNALTVTHAVVNGSTIVSSYTGTSGGKAVNISTAGADSYGLYAISTATGTGSAVYADSTLGSALALAAFASRSNMAVNIRNFGSGHGLEVTGGSGGTAIIATGSIIATTGDVRAPPSYGFTYSSNRTAVKWIHWSEFAISSPATQDVGNNYIVNSSTTTTATAVAQVHVPPGATITGVDVFAMNDSAVNTTWGVALNKFDETGTTTIAMLPFTNFTSVLTGSPAFVSVSLGTAVDLTCPLDLTGSNGMVQLGVSVPKDNGTTGPSRLRFVKITYTYPNVTGTSV